LTSVLLHLATLPPRMTPTVLRPLRTPKSGLLIAIAALFAIFSRSAIVPMQHRKSAYTTSAVCRTNDGTAVARSQMREQKLPTPTTIRPTAAGAAGSVPDSVMSSMGACGGIQVLHNLIRYLLLSNQPYETWQVRRFNDKPDFLHHSFVT
jgi:hypothetical protein